MKELLCSWVVLASLATACGGAAVTSGDTCCTDCGGSRVCGDGLTCAAFVCPADGGPSDGGTDAPDETCCDDCAGSSVCGNGLVCTGGFECPTQDAGADVDANADAGCDDTGGGLDCFCGTAVCSDGHWGCGPCSGALCPSTAPTHGSACPEAGLNCNYTACGMSSGHARAYCSATTWEVTTSACAQVACGDSSCDPATSLCVLVVNGGFAPASSSCEPNPCGDGPTTDACACTVAPCAGSTSCTPATADYQTVVFQF